MREASQHGFRISPLWTHLREVAEGKRPMPGSDAKRHHFIPQMLLNRFSADGANVFQLDLTSGAPRRVPIEKAASRRRFYSFHDEEGQRHNRVEAYFGLVESYAAEALKRLEASGARDLSDGDRATIAFFVALLGLRTPQARTQGEQMQHVWMQLLMSSHIGDAEAFLRYYREGPLEDEDMSDDEIEELRKRMIKQLADGSIGFDDAAAAAMKLLIGASGDVATTIYHMRWIVVRSDHDEFINSDRGLSMFDPTPRFPWSGNAWASSPNAQNLIPISRHTCLLTTPGRPTTEWGDTDPIDVLETNLRTYGWADRYILGSTQEAVAQVRRQAKKRRDLVARPRMHRPVMLLEAVEGDETLANAHRKRGWPPYLAHHSEGGGRPQKMDYMVIGEDGDPVEIGVASTEIVMRRARAGELTDNEGSLESAE